MDGLEAEFGDEVAFMRLNAIEPDVMQLQQTYGLRGHPSVAILDSSGAVAALYFGPETAETLREELNKLAE
ncbi:MAG: hypothetical protein KC433_24015 [Anaerolineales bacterium]|nr:hypothetical protein [Anaerolineales bacterium]MCB8937080.1 hypothetical protein [Ardenticatenaceae bacterium]